MNMPNRIYRGEYDIPIVKVFVDNNLDIKDFLCGVFQGNKSAFACLAVHIDVGWKDSKVLKALYDIFHTNANAILDKILQAQQMKNLPDLKSRLAAVKYSGSFTYKDSSPTLSTMSPTTQPKPTYEDEIVKVDSIQSLLKQSRSQNSSKELKEIVPIVSQHFDDERHYIYQGEPHEPAYEERGDKNRFLFKQSKSLNSYEKLNEPGPVVLQHIDDEIHHTYQSERLEQTHEDNVPYIRSLLKQSKSFNSLEEVQKRGPVSQHFDEEIHHIYQTEQFEPVHKNEVVKNDTNHSLVKQLKSLNAHQELKEPVLVIPQRFSDEIPHIYESEQFEPVHKNKNTKKQSLLKQNKSLNSHEEGKEPGSVAFHHFNDGIHHIFQNERFQPTYQEKDVKNNVNRSFLKQQKSLNSHQDLKDAGRSVVFQHFDDKLHHTYPSESFEPKYEDKVDKNQSISILNKSLNIHQDLKEVGRPVVFQHFDDKLHHTYPSESVEPTYKDKVDKSQSISIPNKSLNSHQEHNEPSGVVSQHFLDEINNIYHGKRFYYIKRFLENNCKAFEDLTIEKYLPNTHLKYKVDLSRSSDFTKPLIERSNREINLSAKVISESKDLIKRCLTVLERNRKVLERISQDNEI